MMYSTRQLVPDCEILLKSVSKIRTIGNHSFQIGAQNRPDTDFSGIVNDLRRFDLAGPHDIMETFEREIETDMLSEPKAINDCLGLIKYENRHTVNGVGLHTEGKGSLSLSLPRQ